LGDARNSNGEDLPEGCDICVGLRHGKTFILSDDGCAERRVDFVVVTEVVVEGLVRHNAATWAAQQVSVLRYMTDDAWDLLLSRLLRC
jgi:hypothetical protein